MAERLRHLIVDQDEVGSTPIHRAKFSGPSSNGRISGSQPEDASSTLAAHISPNFAGCQEAGELHKLYLPGAAPGSATVR